MSARPELRGPDAKPDVVVRDDLAAAPLRFRILTRISDDKLRSIPQQIADCADYVESLDRGAVIDGLYNLGEHSGFSMTESDVYQRLLADAKAGRFHALVVRDTSRMGRDYWEKLGFLRDLREAKLEFHVVEDGGRFDFEDRLAKVKSWASTWADEEKKKEEIRKAIRATNAVRDAGFPTVTPPYGYRTAKDPTLGRNVWKIDEREAPTVRACFQAIADGARMADVQRAHGLTYHQLDRMLRNPSYLGGYLWRGELRRCAPEVVPPLVDDETWARVRARRGA
ncbi:MAG TPA: recombinase family protein [Candidatus Thermoplasmatota archaeon]|nr:recombinase family protein [Candidatus Thermoplasmatota archaeon]